jgi:hypothetical protein
MRGKTPAPRDAAQVCSRFDFVGGMSEAEMVKMGWFCRCLRRKEIEEKIKLVRL